MRDLLQRVGDLFLFVGNEFERVGNVFEGVEAPGVWPAEIRG